MPKNSSQRMPTPILWQRKIMLESSHDENPSLEKLPNKVSLGFVDSYTFIITSKFFYFCRQR
jgi:hypothetical protein